MRKRRFSLQHQPVVENSPEARGVGENTTTMMIDLRESPERSQGHHPAVVCPASPVFDFSPPRPSPVFSSPGLPLAPLFLSKVSGDKKIPRKVDRVGSAVENHLSPFIPSVSRFGACPICCASCPIALMSLHLDLECSGNKKQKKENRENLERPEDKNTVAPLFLNGPQPAASFLPRSGLDALPVSRRAFFILNLPENPPSGRFWQFSTLNWAWAEENSDFSTAPDVLLRQKFRVSPGASETIEIALQVRAKTNFLNDAALSPLCVPISLSSLGSSKFSFSPSFCKSLLQKNIRLSRPTAAVRSAAELLRVTGKFQELLRRIIIIAIEDAFLQTNLPLVVFLLVLQGATERRWSAGLGAPLAAIFPRPTAGERGEDKIPYWQIQFVLEFVGELAAVSLKDCLTGLTGLNTEAEEVGEAEAPVNWLSYSTLSGIPGALVHALLLRSAFGGMSCDVSLLRNAAALWARRFEKEKEKEKENARDWLKFLNEQIEETRATASKTLAMLENLKPPFQQLELENGDLLLSAVDHHCSDLVSDLLQEASVAKAVEAKFPGENARSVIESALWFQRSSLSVKNVLAQNPPVLDQTHAALFQEIRASVDKMARKFIARKARGRKEDKTTEIEKGE